MARQTKNEFWTSQVAQQKKWIENNGGDLTGYIARYGDPGLLATEGPRRGKPMFGNGGTAIYNADIEALRRYEANLPRKAVR